MKINCLNAVSVSSYYKTHTKAIIGGGANSDESNSRERGWNIWWNERDISMLGFYLSSTKLYWGAIYLRLMQQLTD